MLQEANILNYLVIVAGYQCRVEMHFLQACLYLTIAICVSIVKEGKSLLIIMNFEFHTENDLQYYHQYNIIYIYIIIL